MPNYRYQTPDTMCRTRNVCKESCMEQRMPGRDICDGPIAMAYVPWQQNCNMYENLDEAFRVGTIFPVLNKPFKGGEKCR